MSGTVLTCCERATTWGHARSLAGMAGRPAPTATKGIASNSPVLPNWSCRQHRTVHAEAPGCSAVVAALRAEAWSTGLGGWSLNAWLNRSASDTSRRPTLFCVSAFSFLAAASNCLTKVTALPQGPSPLPPRPSDASSTRSDREHPRRGSPGSRHHAEWSRCSGSSTRGSNRYGSFPLMGTTGLGPRTLLQTRSTTTF